MLVHCTGGKPGAYGLELLDKKKIRLEKKRQKEEREEKGAESGGSDRKEQILDQSKF